jgi:hypothetical protein
MKSPNGQKPIAKMTGILLDIKAILAEALLEIDPINFSTSYRREGGILADTDKIREHPIYGKPIPLCLGFSSDKTQCNNSGSVCEQAVVLSILNAKNDAYKMLFGGFVPLELPYSDRLLDGLLGRKGF